MIFIIVVGNEGDDFSRAFFSGMETGFELYVGETKELAIEAMLADPPKGKRVCWLENNDIPNFARGKEFVLSDDFTWISKQKYHLMEVKYNAADEFGSSSLRLDIFVPNSLAENIEVAFLEGLSLFWKDVSEHSFVRDDIKGKITLKGKERFFRVDDGNVILGDDIDV
jgi:hypothetical protein